MPTETHVTINSVGVAGPPGPQGEQGPVGSQGVPGIIFVEHGTDANVARPDSPLVYWVGSVLPNNAIATDLWYQP